jgi:hypothetical protein
VETEFVGWIAAAVFAGDYRRKVYSQWRYRKAGSFEF